MKPLIQMTRTGLKFSGLTKDLHRLRREFDRQHCVCLPNIFEKELLKEIDQVIEQAHFHKRIHRDVGVESCMRLNKAYRLLLFLANDSKFFDKIQKITGCDDIGCFSGRVYRMVPGQGHYDSWHSDIDGKNGRLIAMSINLSKEVYDGGSLQIRQGESGKIIYEIENVGFGDAIIFRLDSCLQHRLTTLKGKRAKTAFAGWFQSHPKFTFHLKKKIRHGLSLRRHSRIPRFIMDHPIKPAEDVAFINVGPNTALLEAQNGFYYKLDPVGSRIWDLMRKKHNFGAVVKTLSEEYDADSKRIEKDTLCLVRHLYSNGLVENEINGNSPL